MKKKKKKKSQILLRQPHLLHTNIVRGDRFINTRNERFGMNSSGRLNRQDVNGFEFNRVFLRS